MGRAYRLFFSVCILALIMFIRLTPSQAAPPTLPAAFFGTVTIDGRPAADGLFLEVRIAGISFATTQIVSVSGQSGYYSLQVPGDDPDTPLIVEGGRENDRISFFLGTVALAPTGTWNEGALIALNISGSAIPTPTPTATVTPGGPTLTPTATVTPGGPTPTPTATVTPGGPTATPTATLTPGGPTLTPTPTSTTIPITQTMLLVNVSDGAPGSVFAITGAQFPPNTPLSVLVNGEPLSITLQSDANGSFAFLLQTSALAQDGVYEVLVTTSGGRAYTAAVISAQVRYIISNASSLRREPIPPPATRANVPPSIRPLHLMFVPPVSR